MRRLITLAAIASIIGIASAQGQEQPDEATKTWALKRGYEINNHSMVRWGSIDLTKEIPPPPPSIVKTVPIPADDTPKASSTTFQKK